MAEAIGDDEARSMLEQALFDISDMTNPTEVPIAQESGGAGRLRPPSKRNSTKSFGDALLDTGEQKPKKRKRVLACPLCKMLNQDGSMVADGQACNGGHIMIDNTKKIWRCLQCDRSLSINGSWVTTAKRHFDDNGNCVAVREGKAQATKALLGAPPVQVCGVVPAGSYAGSRKPSGRPPAPPRAPFGLRCCECGQGAQFQCDSCGGNLYCARCDTKIHTKSFRFLQSHKSKALVVERKADGSCAVKGHSDLKCFPPCGDCHKAQIVRLCKEDNRVPLFPATDKGKATFELTMKIDSGVTVPLTDFFWENWRTVTVSLPSYASFVGSNHPPHQTQCDIVLRETSQGIDPPLTWTYTYEHTELLDKIVMLEAVNTALKDLVELAPTGPAAL